MKPLEQLLAESAARHPALCPRQVLGVRMGLYAGRLLALDLPQTDKRLVVIVETDGCATDGIAVATNCSVSRRTMRIEDYGKVAATFVDTLTNQAIRLTPRSEVRHLAKQFAPGISDRWEAMLVGYQRMPDTDLLSAQPVELDTPIGRLVSRPGQRVICDACGEEIMNEREIRTPSGVFCRACLGQAYYHLLNSLEAENACGEILGKRNLAGPPRRNGRPNHDCNK